MAKRPLTQKEIQKKKAPAKEVITIHNRSRQLIKINIKTAPGSDFYYSSRDVDLYPGKIVTLPKSRLWPTQLSRLQKRGMISILADSEKLDEEKREMMKRRRNAEVVKEQQLEEKKEKKVEEAKKSKAAKKAKKKAKTGSTKADELKESDMTKEVDDNSGDAQIETDNPPSDQS